MKFAQFIGIIGSMIMSGVIAYGFIKGDFSREGKQLTSMPWGIITLTDLYVGLTLFSGWIVYREKSILRSVVWVFCMMTLGFLAGCLYILKAVFESNGNWYKFWMGQRWQDV